MTEREHGRLIQTAPGYFDGLDETDGTTSLLTKNGCMDWIWTTVEKQQAAENARRSRDERNKTTDR